MGSTGLPGLILVLLPVIRKFWPHRRKILYHTHPYYIKPGSGYPLGKLWSLQPSNTTFYGTRAYARNLGMYCKGTISYEHWGNKPDTAFLCLNYAGFWDFSPCSLSCLALRSNSNQPLLSSNTEIWLIILLSLLWKLSLRQSITATFSARCTSIFLWLSSS